jgi:hypothetical protein
MLHNTYASLLNTIFVVAPLSVISAYAPLPWHVTLCGMQCGCLSPPDWASCAGIILYRSIGELHRISTDVTSFLTTCRTGCAEAEIRDHSCNLVTILSLPTTINLDMRLARSSLMVKNLCVLTSNLFLSGTLLSMILAWHDLYLVASVPTPPDNL